MFKSIRWKIALLFMMFIIAAETLIGSFLLFFTINYFHKDFKNTISETFTNDLKNGMYEIAEAEISVVKYDENGIETTVVTEAEDENIAADLKNYLSDKLNYLNLSSSRFWGIINGKTGEVMYSSNNIEKTDITAVLINAMNGGESITAAFRSSYMDYAVPIEKNGEVKLIVYVKDTEELQNYVVKSLAVLMLYIIAASAVISFIAGSMLSKSIARPIRELTENAKKLAGGDIKALEHTGTNDEISELTESLINLAQARQESTDAVKGEKIKVETILQNMSDGILAFDMKGRLIHINPEASRLLQRKYLDDINFNSFFKEINANITLGDLVYMQTSSSIEREIKLENSFLQLNFATFTVDKKISGIIVVIHDITRQEKLEQSRRDFVANVSHELRTPLTTIKSYSETLADMPAADNELRTRFLGVIASEADRMANIISDLLTLSELDENQAYFKPAETINISKMLEILVDRMSLQAKKKNMTLTYSPITEIPIITGDYGCLERVFINIISNSLKYTKDGGKIEIFSSKVYSDITVKIKDNGIGIEPEKLPHIFDRFYRVDKARSRDTGGTGLGLAIAKQSIESGFNGKIKITSEYGKGTEVTITIPVER